MCAQSAGTKHLSILAIFLSINTANCSRKKYVPMQSVRRLVQKVYKNWKVKRTKCRLSGSLVTHIIFGASFAKKNNLLFYLRLRSPPLKFWLRVTSREPHNVLSWHFILRSLLTFVRAFQFWSETVKKLAHYIKMCMDICATSNAIRLSLSEQIMSKKTSCGFGDRKNGMFRRTLRLYLCCRTTNLTIQTRTTLFSWITGDLIRRRVAICHTTLLLTLAPKVIFTWTLVAWFM